MGNKANLRETAGVCIYCGHPITVDIATVDHIIPVSRGGMNEDFNRVCSCPACNKLKGNHSVYAFTRQMGLKKRRAFVNRVETLYFQGQIDKEKRELLLGEKEDSWSWGINFWFLSHHFKFLMIVH